MSASQSATDVKTPIAADGPSQKAALFKKCLAEANERAKHSKDVFQPGDRIYYRMISFGETGGPDLDVPVTKELYTHIRLAGVRVVHLDVRGSFDMRGGCLNITCVTLDEVKSGVLDGFRKQSKYTNFSYDVSRCALASDMVFEIGCFQPCCVDYDACGRFPLIGMFKGCYFSEDAKERFWDCKSPQAVAQVKSVVKEPFEGASLIMVSNLGDEMKVCSLGSDWKV